VHNGVSVWASQPMLVFGSSIGSGNYVRSDKPVLCESLITLEDYDTTSLSVLRDASAGVDINLEVQSHGKIPKGTKAVYGHFQGTCTTVAKSISIYDYALGYESLYVYSTVATYPARANGWMPCGRDDGDLRIISSDATEWNNLRLEVYQVDPR